MAGLWLSAAALLLGCTCSAADESSSSNTTNSNYLNPNWSSPSYHPRLQPGENQHEWLISPNATAYIGVLLNVHARGAGLFECGPPTRQGIIWFESLQWIIDILNNERGGFFLPGIDIGARIFDSCGRFREAANQLSEFYPQLKNNNNGELFNDDRENLDSFQLGLLDGIGLSLDPEISRILDRAAIPTIQLNSDLMIIPTEERAKALVAITKRLGWSRVVIVHGSDQYSAQLIRDLSEALNSTQEVCVVAIEQFELAESRTSSVARLLSHARNARVPVLVAMHFTAFRSFLDMLRNRLEPLSAQTGHASPLRLLFPDLISHREAALFGPDEIAIHSLMYTFNHMNSLEQFWHAKIANNTQAGEAEDPWLREYLQETYCGTTNCFNPRNLSLAEDDLDVALRTREVMSIGHAIATLPLALKHAWQDKCPDQVEKKDNSSSSSIKACENLLKLNRREFYHRYFASEIAQLTNKMNLNWLNEPGNFLSTEMVLYRVDPDKKVRFIKMMELEQQSGIHITPAPTWNQFWTTSGFSTKLDISKDCPSRDLRCVPCLHLLPQPDLKSKFSKPSSTTTQATTIPTTTTTTTTLPTTTTTITPTTTPTPTTALTTILTPSIPSSLGFSTRISVENHLSYPLPKVGSSPYRVLVPASPGGLHIALMLPLHRRLDGDPNDSCERDSNASADSARQIESFLWALNEANLHLQAISSTVSLGGVLVDTCGSRLRAMTQAAALGGGDLELAAVINALPLSDARFVSEILATREVTSVSVMSHAAELASNNQPGQEYILQVEAPLNQLASAVISVLSHLGWTYVSSVYSVQDEISMKSYQNFRDLSARSSICLAVEEALQNSTLEFRGNHLISSLISARATGARGVVVWTTTSDTRRLLQIVDLAITRGNLGRGDLFWLFASVDPGVAQVVRHFGHVFSGALLFRTPQQQMNAFSAHLQSSQLNFKTRQINPWLGQYHKELAKCQDPECRAVLESGLWAEQSIAQGVLAVGAAVGDALASLCPSLEAEAHEFTSTVEPSISYQVNGLAILDTPNNPINQDSNILKSKSCSVDDFERRLHNRKLINRRLRSVIAPYPDGTIGFTFNSEGLGNWGLHILNARRRGPQIILEKVAAYYNGELKTTGAPWIWSRDIAGLDEAPISGLASQCSSGDGCPKCQKTKPGAEWLDTGAGISPLPFYLGLTVPAHDPSSRPLECGTSADLRGQEQLEAFLWALDHIANQSTDEPHLAALAVDTCGSAVKAARDVADLLAKQGDQARPVIAFIAAGDSRVSSAVQEAAGPWGVPVLAPDAAGPPAARKPFAPFPLQLSPSTRILADGLLHMAENLGWACVHLLYQQDGGELEDLFRLLERAGTAGAASIRVQAAVPIPLRGSSGGVSMRAAILRLTALARARGARVVFVLLTSDALELLMRTLRALEDESRYIPGELVWVTMPGSESILNSYPREALGTMTLKPLAGQVLDFENYFRNLTLTDNVRNPWFPELWSRVHHCRGASCRSKEIYPNLHSYRFQHNSPVVNTINSVLAIHHALKTVVRELCPERYANYSHCPNLNDLQRLRRSLLDAVPRMAFVGSGLNGVAFTASGENAHANLQIVQLQRAPPNNEDSTYTLKPVGRIDTDSPPSVDITSLRLYSGLSRDETPWARLVTQCAGLGDGPEEPGLDGMMELRSSRGVAVLGVVPVHQRRRDAGPDECGGVVDTTGALHALALQFAVAELRRNNTLKTELGALVMDTCGQPARGYNALYRYLYRTTERQLTELGLHTPPDGVLATILVDATTTQLVTPLLEAQSIAPLLVSSGSHSHIHTSQVVTLAPDAVAKAVLAVSGQLGAQILIIVRSSSSWANDVTDAVRMAVDAAASVTTDVPCLGGVYTLHSRTTSGGNGPLLETTSANPTGGASMREDLAKVLRPGTLMLILVDTPGEIQALLDVTDNDLEGVAFLSVLGTPELHRFRANGDSMNSFILEPLLERRQKALDMAAAYRRWLVPALLDTRPPLNPPSPQATAAAWLGQLRDYYRSDAARAPADMIREDLDRVDSSLADTMAAVGAVAQGLHQFLEQKPCRDANLTSSPLAECWRRSDDQELIDPTPNYSMRGVLRDQILEAFTIGQNIIAGNFTIRSAGPGIQLATWRTDLGFRVDAEMPRIIELGSATYSLCSGMDDSVSILANRPALYHTLSYPWAASLAGMALLGAFLTILVALYFLAAAALPNANLSAGTSVLGYLILFGLLALFIADLTFVLTPTEAICASRRFLPGVAYAIIFAAMLLKVLTTWRQCDRLRHRRADSLGDAGSSDAGGFDGDSWTSRPGGLVLSAIAMASVQAVISGGWLAVIPPRAYLDTSIMPHSVLTSPGPNWRCYQHGNFESHLLLSLMYIVLLLSTTSLLALLCFTRLRQHHALESPARYEARSILASSLLVAGILLTWGVAAIAVLPSGQADLATALAHLLAANALLLGLYVPKMCLYARIRANRKSGKPQRAIPISPPSCSPIPSPPPPIYDHFLPPLHFRSPTSGLKGLPVKAFIPDCMPPPPPPLPDGDPEDSDDPTQIVPSSLYSLDMFSQSSTMLDDDLSRLDDGEHCEPGSNEFTPCKNPLLGLDEEYHTPEGIAFTKNVPSEY